MGENKDNKLNKYPFRLFDKEDKIEVGALCAAAIASLGLSALSSVKMVDNMTKHVNADTKQEVFIAEVISTPEFQDYYAEELDRLSNNFQKDKDGLMFNSRLNRATSEEGIKEYLVSKGEYDSEFENLNGERLSYLFRGLGYGLLAFGSAAVAATTSVYANKKTKDYNHFAQNRGNCAYKQYVDRLEAYEKEIFGSCEEESKEENSLAEVYLGDGQDKEK